MANWDIFHSERLETERNLTSGAVRAGLLSGTLVHDDLIRPAGTTTPWKRIGDVPALQEIKPTVAPPPRSVATPAPPKPKPVPEPPPSPRPKPKSDSAFDLPVLDDSRPAAFFVDDDEEDEEDDVPFPVDAANVIILPDDDDEDDDEQPEAVEAVILDDDDDDDAPVLHVDSPGLNLTLPGSHSRETFGDFEAHRDNRARSFHLDDNPSSVEIVTWDDEEPDPQAEDEAAAEFTLSRNSSETVEELDLAAMVDVAFQLVLFFLVTATTILYKSLEVPKPNAESNPEAAAQGRKSLDDMKEVFILVEIDPSGGIKVDREPIRADLPTLIESLRKARETTDRKAMLLSADFSTPHKNAVLAYDAANEIGLSIAIARPAPPNPNAPPPPKPPPAPAKEGS